MMAKAPLGPMTKIKTWMPKITAVLIYSHRVQSQIKRASSYFKALVLWAKTQRGKKIKCHFYEPQN